MTWAGEDSASGVMIYSEDGSPGKIAGNPGEIFVWGDPLNKPEFVSQASITGVANIPFDKIITVDLTHPGADFNTVQAAFDAMNAGDTIVVGPGDFPEELMAKVDGTLFSFGGTRIRPTITGGGGRALSRTGNVTFTCINIDFVPIATHTSGVVQAVRWGGTGTLTMFNCPVIPETATGIANDVVLRGLANQSSASIIVHGAVIRVDDALNLITTGDTSTVRLGGNGTITLDGGVRIEAGTNTNGTVRSSDSSSNIILRNVFVENDVDLVSITTATRTGATEIVGTVTGADAGKMTNISEAASPNGITSAAVIGDHRLVRGDGGSRGVQSSNILIDDNDVIRFPGTVNWNKGSDIASAATLALGSDGNYFDVTGTVTITAVSVFPQGTRILLQFDGIVTVTHNATTLILAGGTNFVTAAGNHLELVSYNGTNWREVSRSVAPAGSGAAPSLTKSITIPDPTASQDDTFFKTDVAITITKIFAVVRGSTPSVTWTIRHNTDRSATGAEVVTGGTTTTSQTTGDTVTSFNDATIPAGSFIWIETTAKTGTVNEIAITVLYTED